MKISNFRQYVMSVMSKITQTKKDRKITRSDTLKKKKGLDQYQRGFYHGRLTCLQEILQEIYDDCRKYEWKLTTNKGRIEWKKKKKQRDYNV